MNACFHMHTNLQPTSSITTLCTQPRGTKPGYGWHTSTPSYLNLTTQFTTLTDQEIWMAGAQKAHWNCSIIMFLFGIIDTASKLRSNICVATLQLQLCPLLSKASPHEMVTKWSYAVWDKPSNATQTHSLTSSQFSLVHPPHSVLFCTLM